MTRTLPWLKNNATPSNSSTSTRADQPAVKRRRISTPPQAAPSDIDIDLPLNTTGVSTPSRRRLLRAAKTPSTSPPPAPPDQDIFMREGYAEDDIYMMVEDEFLTTAQAFTQHLHHAEYQRLKGIAREKEKLAKIHGTGGRSKLSAEGAAGAARVAREKTVGAALRKINREGRRGDDDDDEEDDPWLGTELAGLMTSSRQVQQLRAKNMGGGKSDTRAAKGFTLGSQTGRPGEIQARRVSFDVEPRPKSPTSMRKDRRKEKNVASRRRQEDKDHVDVNDDDDDDLDPPLRSSAKGYGDVPPPRVWPYASTHEQSLQTDEAKRLESHQKASRSKISPQERQNHVHTELNSTRAKLVLGSSPPISILRKSSVRDDPFKSSRRDASPMRVSTVEQTHNSVSLDQTAPTQLTTGGGGRFARRRAEREKAKLEKEQQAMNKKAEAEKEESAIDSTEIPLFLF